VPNFENREFYVCCNLRFNADGAVNDAGYDYVNGSTLPLGTKVRVMVATSEGVYISPDGGSSLRYYIEFRFGAPHISAEQFFHNLLLDTDPTPSFQALPPEIQAAVKNRRLVEGMSKEAALMARGYPPYHRTPNGIASDEWLYYENTGVTTRVRFENGNLSQVVSMPAP
jgi:hypothetical protein